MGREYGIFHSAGSMFSSEELTFPHTHISAVSVLIHVASSYNVTLDKFFTSPFQTDDWSGRLNRRQLQSEINMRPI